ncbi:UDP-N-acetylmuramoyl-tripeptide--D-alanyl-D-alanine ligase [Luteimonas cucumeris]|uniref:UDP-N-acetylmuramoyl-tripeptide--D-alanyl-D-alanine ligase n=1 Tax=Luteimonas cucumeris TaxID=985012 RepID=A0A562L5G6_9GAMM|nr:UDP-N-acetylmuramoyl-tripeptide--D-alanyl-D-alanine ligase [Luteimonas cucumeris]TWI02909.1 UDP-N-acetylmuramoyl-tripeptide--D-alanyl-D-alanine ligase [Luteimonas cucumeris]
MKPLSLSAIARMTGGRLHGVAVNGAAVKGDDVVVDAIATDTRALPATGAALFVALKGERFDGHDHVAVFAKSSSTTSGAAIAAALVSRELAIDLPQIVVADTERALAALAGALQRERGGKVVAITGSNGKTSVKTLLLSILAQDRGRKAYANPGNRNNEIGLPLAVIDAPEDADIAIYEMGAGKPGDIAYLTAVVRPDVALVNNIAPAHLERMGSLLGVADTKAAIYDALPADGVAVINADDAFAPYFAERAHGRRILRFGLEATADISARDVRATAEGMAFILITPAGDVDIALPLPGRHNVSNALAAACLALGAGASLDTIAAGLGAARAVAGRLVAHRLDGNVQLIDDSYNANPGSLNAAIETLAGQGGESWLVLGDMRELGADAEALHAAAGRRAKSAGIARLYALGTLSAAAAQAFGDGGRAFESHEALARALRSDLQAVTDAPSAVLRVLVKGSRGSAMDRVVSALLSKEPSTNTGGTDAA